MTGLNQMGMLPSIIVPLACCEFSERLAEGKKELAIFRKKEKEFSEDFKKLQFALFANPNRFDPCSDPGAASRKIEEKINTLKGKGVNDKEISRVLYWRLEDIAIGIRDAAEYRNFTHIIKLSELLRQYGFTKDDIAHVFKHIDLSDNGIDFVNCIEEMLKKNDIDSLQKFTQFLSEGDCNLRYELELHVYLFFRELTDVIKEDPNKVIERISLLERIGLSEAAKSEIFERALCRAINIGDKDLENAVRALQKNQTLS